MLKEIFSNRDAKVGNLRFTNASPKEMFNQISDSRFDAYPKKKLKIKIKMKIMTQHQEREMNQEKKSLIWTLFTLEKVRSTTLNSCLKSKQ